MTRRRKKKLLDGVRDVIRTKHHSMRTEQAYVGWIRRLILFHDKRHPKGMGADEIPPLEGTPVVVDKCARAQRERGIRVPGCPPHGTAITDAAYQALGIDVDEVHRAIDDLHDFSYEEVSSDAKGGG